MSTYTGDADGGQNAPISVALPEDHVTLRKAASVNAPLRSEADQLEWLRTRLPLTNTKGIAPGGDVYPDGQYSVQVIDGAITLVPFDSATFIPGMNSAGLNFDPYIQTMVFVDGLAYSP